MRGDAYADEPQSEPLTDLTEALTLRSKKTSRLLKKQRRRTGNFGKPKELFDLPGELLLEILSWLRPSDIFVLLRACTAFRSLILDNEQSLANRVLDFRYATISNCLHLPVRIEDVPQHMQQPLRDPRRQELMAIHGKTYQHIPSANPVVICTCLSCKLRWNSLCLVVDFAHWQSNLEQGEPIPMIDRGDSPLWNRKLMERASSIVMHCLRSRLWYSAILQAHLASTVRSISRHSTNKGNKRRRFRMTTEDEFSGTDHFLDNSGPPTLEFPFHRDNYYMLEVYLPNRAWSSEQKRWLYVPPSQHEIDLELVQRWAERNGIEASSRSVDA